jgi:diguanylate cyclase (GGDEF)-like protein
VFSLLDSSGVPDHFEPALEAAYQADLAFEKIRAFYRSSLLCSLLYVGFGVLDVVALPLRFADAWTLRATVLVATAIASLAPRFTRAAFLDNYPSFTCLVYLLWGLGAEGIILLTYPSDPGWSTYYAGIILVSMALYSLSYLRPLHAGLTGAALALTYVVLALADQHMGDEENWVVLLQNCFFLIGANCVGLIALHMRERFSRQAFLLKNALTHDLRLEEEAKRQSQYLSEHDPLTGLPNRVRFLRRLEELIAHRQEGERVAVLFLDLDGFKPVNDRYGHAAGDHVLRCVAERVRHAIRASDLAARLGGDEFVVALPLAAGQLECSVDRVRAALAKVIAEPIGFSGQVLRVTASVGAAVCPDQAASAAELMHAADQSMYRAKRLKRSGEIHQAIQLA